MKYRLTCFLLIYLSFFIQLANGQYSRPSVAYYFNKTSGVMHQYEVNEPCFKTMAVCNVSDGEYRYGEGPLGGDIEVHAKNSAYVFGIDKTTGRLVRSQNGFSNWENTGFTENISAGVIWALESGTILIYDRVTPYTYLNILYRSTDNGDTVDAVLSTNEEGFSSDFPAYLRPWSLYQAPHGTIVIAEYGKPGTSPTGRRIFRSDNDGQAFSKVWDLVEAGEYYVHHHALCYQSNLNRWVVVCGDGKQWCRLLASDNDGVAGSWYNLTEPHRTYIQPTALLDYGHSTRLLFGSDTKTNIGWVDVSDVNTGLFGNVLSTWDPRPNLNLCFLMFEYNGLYYACNYSTLWEGKNTVISVSSDLEHWAVYHRFINNENGCWNFAGYAGGKLHLNVIGADQKGTHFAISPAQVSTQKTLVIEPGVSNAFDDSNQSSFEENLDGWYFGNYWTIHEITTTEKQHDQTSMHLTGVVPAGSGLGAYSPKINVETSKSYQGRFWIKGRNTSVTARYSGSSLSAIGEYSTSLVDNTWQEIVLEPYTVKAADGNNLGINIYLGDWDPGQDSEEIEVYIDSMQIEEVPGTNWQVGGTGRASTKLHKVHTLSEEWTNTFTFYPAGRKEHYDGLATGKKLYIKSWQAGDAYAELYYDPNVDSFVLFVDDDTNSYSIRTEAQHFQRLAQVKFAIVCYQDELDSNKTKLKMHLANGRALETPSLSASESFDAFGQGSVSTCIGDKDGLDLFPGLISHDNFVVKAVRDEDIKWLLDIAGTGFLAADLNSDLHINFEDFCIFALHWRDTNCIFPYSCNEVDLDWSSEIDYIDMSAFITHWLTSEMLDP